MEDSLIFEPPFSASRPGKAKRVYRCPDCHRNFKRREHCARHQRTHTRERPFACTYCGKTYARKDMVKRHEQTLHPHGVASTKTVKKPRSDSSGGSSDTTESSSRLSIGSAVMASVHEEPQSSPSKSLFSEQSTSSAPSTEDPSYPENSSMPVVANPSLAEPWPGPILPPQLHIIPQPNMPMPADLLAVQTPFITQVDGFVPDFYPDMHLQGEPFPGEMMYLMDQEFELSHSLPLDDAYIPIDPQLG